jgi:alkylated DNA repair dioxygenase AlkB
VCVVITYYPSFIRNPNNWFDTLWSQLAWERRPDAPRREYWTTLLNRPYTYGRGRGIRTYEPQPDHRLIQQARQRLLDEHDHWLEGCFLNGYEHGRDWLGWHSDDDPGIDHRKPIAIITVGEGRAIQFRKILEPDGPGFNGRFADTKTLMLEPGSLCLMDAGMQFTHQHRIPKLGLHAVKPRVSLTFRGLLA